MKEIICYCYYNDKKQRLSIKAIQIDEEHTEITIVKCSIKDQFNKKLARIVLKNGEFKSTKVIIAHYGEFRKSLFDYLDENYFRLAEGQLIYDTQELRKGLKTIVLSKKLNCKLW